MTFALIAAGLTGVEVECAISELAHWVLSREFRHIDTGAARILLLEVGPRVLSGFSDKL